MIVELAQPADLPVCAAISAASFTPPAFDLEEESRRTFARIWVARFGIGAPPSGFLLAWHVADEIHVLTVATLPSARRQGLGSALVASALSYARASRVVLLVLEVRRGNDAAIALYRRHGFVVVHVRRAYYADGADGLDMTLRLDPETGAALPGEELVE